MADTSGTEISGIPKIIPVNYCEIPVQINRFGISDEEKKYAVFSNEAWKQATADLMMHITTDGFLNSSGNFSLWRNATVSQNYTCLYGNENPSEYFFPVVSDNKKIGGIYIITDKKYGYPVRTLEIGHYIPPGQDRISYSEKLVKITDPEEISDNVKKWENSMNSTEKLFSYSKRDGIDLSQPLSDEERIAVKYLQIEK